MTEVTGAGGFSDAEGLGWSLVAEGAMPEIGPGRQGCGVIYRQEGSLLWGQALQASGRAP